MSGASLSFVGPASDETSEDRHARRLPSAKAGEFRADIQALRAVAVFLVVTYHFWPRLLPGGYVGVDVFFVISGFLITAHLRQRAEGRGLSLLSFYGRRIRRLLPASLLVLAVAAVGILALLPKSEWPINLSAILAGTFYVENWFLALNSTDYLSGSAAVENPVQHYWSLSTEEQLYLVWPLLILVTTAVVAKTGRRHLTLWVLAACTIASFIASVLWTASDPSVAYFAMPTRAWEFGAGALLTFLPERWMGRLPSWSAIGAVWAGLALVAASGLTFGDVVEFPGAIALVPVIGAVLVIAANQPRGAFSLQPLAELPPLQKVGDWSYAIYLWHWPLLILIPLALGDAARSNVGKLVIVSVAILLSWLTREYVEKPCIRFKRGARIGARVMPLDKLTLIAAGAGMLAVTLITLPPLTVTGAEAANQRDQLKTTLAEAPKCLGAGALTSGSCPPSTTSGSFVPGLLIAGKDQSALDSCQVAPHAPAHHCELGPTDGIPVALVGDSHASQWLLAVEAAANAYNWRVTTYLAGACPLFVPQSGHPQSTTRGCSQWQLETLGELIRTKYKYVIVAGQGWDAVEPTSRDPRTAEFRTIAESISTEYANAWNQLALAGSHVIVIADTPSPSLAGLGGVPTCVELRGQQGCRFPRDAAVASNESLTAALALAPSARMVDMTDLICPVAADCSPVVGSVLVWADGSHITKTYIQTLEPAFVKRIGHAAR